MVPFICKEDPIISWSDLRWSSIIISDLTLIEEPRENTRDLGSKGSLSTNPVMSDVMILFLSNIGKIITMTAQVGEDVFLSHYLKLPKELTETLKCYKVVVDEKDKMVGLGRNFYIDCFKDKPPKDNSKLPSPENSGRTSLLLKDVILFNVTRADEGNYIFAFPLERKEYTIQLLIGENATSRADKMDFKCVCVCVCDVTYSIFEALTHSGLSSTTRGVATW